MRATEEELQEIANAGARVAMDVAAGVTGTGAPPEDTVAVFCVVATLDGRYSVTGNVRSEKINEAVALAAYEAMLKGFEHHAAERKSHGRG